MADRSNLRDHEEHIRREIENGGVKDATDSFRRSIARVGEEKSIESVVAAMGVYILSQRMAGKPTVSVSVVFAAVDGSLVFAGKVKSLIDERVHAHRRMNPEVHENMSTNCEVILALGCVGIFVDMSAR